MRRGLTWLAGAIGLLALLRHLSRRRAAAPAAPPEATPPVGEDPADELRRRLAERQEGEGAEAPDADPEAGTAALEERRARVHAQAQEAIDSMRDAGLDDPDGGAAA